MESNIVNKLKYNAIVIKLYGAFLDLQCKNVKSYLFVATTGRSGSNTLSEIFKNVKNTISIHEKYPALYNISTDYERENCKNLLEFHKKEFKKKKIINIKRLAAGHQFYVETSHMFIKNYANEAVKTFGDKTKVIHLRRDPVLVASSFYQINSIPGKSSRGIKYLLNPERSDNIIKIADLMKENSIECDLLRCLWYCYEIEARTRRLKKDYPSIKCYKIKTDELNDIEKVIDMLRFFKMPYDLMVLEKVIGKKYNLKIDKKRISIEKEKVMEINMKLLEIIKDRYGESFASTLI